MTDSQSLSKISEHTNAVSNLREADSESELCNLAVEGAAVIHESDLVGMWLYDADAEELQLVSQTSKADRLFGTDIVYEPGNSVSWRAFESGEVLHFCAESDDGKYNDDSIVQSEIVIPVGEYGVLNVASERMGHFTDTDIELAKSFGQAVTRTLDHINETHALRVQNDRLEEVISIVSHDLRNPLTVAGGRVQYALDNCNCQNLDEHLETASSNLDRMGTLIEDLLLLADKGYVVESRTALDLNSLAKEAWENVDSQEAELVVREPTDVFGEKKRLLQVFENLFRNAIEHGGSDVTIKVRPLESFQTSTRGDGRDEPDGFIIEDDGEGLVDDEEFDIFSSGTSTSGMGLGLSIVKRIVEAHGWKIDAGTSPNRGAQFEISAGQKSVTPFR